MGFLATFVKGILCNWLVCMAVYLASFAKDVIGKMVAIWFCISAFVALGLEPSVANMFIIPLGIMNGAAVTWKAFLMQNLLLADNLHEAFIPKSKAGFDIAQHS